MPEGTVSLRRKHFGVDLIHATLNAATLAKELGDYPRMRRILDRVERQIAASDDLGENPVRDFEMTWLEQAELRRAQSVHQMMKSAEYVLERIGKSSLGTIGSPVELEDAIGGVIRRAIRAVQQERENAASEK